MIMKMRDMMKRKNGQKGFTLIELIVVMAILAVLAAIAVPRYTGMLEQTKVKADAATCVMLNQSTDLYKVSTGSYPTGKDFDALMANPSFVGANGYFKEAVTATANGGSFVYTESSGLVQYKNANFKQAEITAMYPAFKAEMYNSGS